MPTRKKAGKAEGAAAEPDPLLLPMARVMFSKGKALMQKDNYKEALGTIEGAMELMERARAGPEDMVPLLVVRSRLYLFMGELDKSEAFALRSMEMITRPGIKAFLKGEATGMYGLALLARGDLVKCLENLERALSLYETAKDKDGIATSTRLIGNVYLMRSQYGKALAYYKRSLKLCEELHNVKEVGGTLNNIALAKGLQGLHSDAIKDFNKMLEVFTDETHQRLRASVHTNIGYFNCLLGKWDEALKHYDESVAISKRVGYGRVDGYNIVGRAEVLVGRGDVRGAEKTINECYKAVMGSKNEDVMGRLMRVRGVIHREKREMEKAEEDFSMAERFLGVGGHEVFLAQNYIEWARARLLKGDGAGAKALFDKARKIYRDLNLSILERALDEIIKKESP